ncbi:MAG TPA: glycine betaine/L-proline ABC transporter ATP-binding protein [Spirochaetes bacterium]|nr:glycine betaine/L-proline ABC transporter ATP-binding protein [Spirochaetota bacterium]
MDKITVENVYKIFGKHPERALKMLNEGKSKNEIMEKTGHAVGVVNASFTVHEGETLVVMGLSGSGKSTLLRCVNRLFEPTSGKVLVDGTDVLALDEKELREFRRYKFGMVFQRFALFPHRTVIENTEFGLEIQGVDKEARKAKSMESLDLVGLKGWENSYPEQLSGGMQQRVGLARALAVDPDILLMDEAFSALDPLIRAEMQDELISLQNKVKKTILFITHDLDEALKLGDRIVLMKDGKIVQVGTPEEILTNPATAYVERFVENVDMTRVLTAKDVMVKAGYVVHPKDGPRGALHSMRERGISSIFVLEKSRELLGIVMAENAREAVERGEQTLEKVIEPYEQNKVTPDTPLADILPMMVDIRYPVAVVDEANKLVGIIVRGSVIAGLAERRSSQ